MNKTEDLKTTSNKKTLEKELINDILLSALSIDEYCSKTGIPIAKLKNICIRYAKSCDIEKANIGKTLLERSNAEFLNNFKNIVLLELTKEEADIFDYLDITRFSAKDFREILTGLIPLDIIKEILTRTDPHRIEPAYNLNQFVCKEARLSCNTVIGGRTVTREEKEKIYIYLEENNYPSCLFMTALKKYLSGRLNLDSKVLVKE